jgi:putative phosphoribosyl transferase
MTWYIHFGSNVFYNSIEMFVYVISAKNRQNLFDERSMMETRYRDRTEAGQVLTSLLTAYAHRRNVLVLALPRGGVPVAYEVARVLHVPLDVFLVRKLGVPGHEELAMGAIAMGGIRVINEDIVRSLQVPPHIVDAVALREGRELERREQLYRDDRPLPIVYDQTTILIDDGLATGATMRAAVHALRVQDPAEIIVAVPVAAYITYRRLQTEVDDIICPQTPEIFYGVGWWYEDFSQTSDQQVHELLSRAAWEKAHH